MSGTLRIVRLLAGGYIDNTTRGIVALGLRFFGRDDFLEFTLKGDCRLDLAGCRFRFRNSSARVPLSQSDRGCFTMLAQRRAHLRMGDMTASLRRCARDASGILHNVISLEFFDIQGKRILVEDARARLRLEACVWKPDASSDAVQDLLNQDAFRHYIQQTIGAYILSHTPAEDQFPENAWDRKLRKAEAMAFSYSLAKEKYGDLPGWQARVAYALQWHAGLARIADGGGESSPPFNISGMGFPSVTDFLPRDEAAAVHHAMENLLFLHLSELTDSLQPLCKSRPRLHDGTPAQKRFEALMKMYSFIVPHLLGTLLELNEKPMNVGMLSPRVERLAQSMDSLIHCLSGFHEEYVNTDILPLAERLRIDLLRFLSNLPREKNQ